MSEDLQHPAGTPAGRQPAAQAVAPAGGGRLMLVLTAALIGLVLAIAARSEAPPAGDRVGRRVELMELIGAEQARARSLEAKVGELSAQVEQFEEIAGRGAEELEALQERVDAISAPAGFTAVRGPGVNVTLSDSTQPYTDGVDPNDLVIHEQDLQAVINGLWSGGAEAISVNGQRVLATTAIRCVGNTLLLHGGLYPPPYHIHAIGDPAELRNGLERDPAVERFAAATQEFELGFEVVDSKELRLPAYKGLSALRTARPVEASAG